MSFPVSLVRRWLSECVRNAPHVADAEPLHVDLTKSSDEKQAWQQRVSRWNGVRLTQHSGDQDSRCRILCRFLVPDPTAGDTYFRRDEFRLQFDTDGRIHLCFGDPSDDEVSAVVFTPGQVQDVARRANRHWNALAIETSRKRRAEQFRKRAVQTRLRQMADDLGCELFWTLHDSTVLVSVVLATTSRFEFSSDLKTFENEFPRNRQSTSDVLDRHASDPKSESNAPPPEWESDAEKIAPSVGPID